MSDIKLVTAEIETTVKNFLTIADGMSGQITVLQGHLHTMLNGSLVLPQSSEALRQSYEQFEVGLRNMTEGIRSFSTQFTNIKDGLLEYDKNVSEQIKNNMK